MTEQEAITIANAFVKQTTGDDPRLQGERYRYDYLKSRIRKDGKWSIVYAVVFPDHPDRIWDGPVVVVVNPQTQEASYL